MQDLTINKTFSLKKSPTHRRRTAKERMREIVISMKLNRHLYRLALHLRTRYKNMEVVAGVMGTSSRTVRNWKTSKKITITPQIIEGLNSCGYDIAVVPIDENDS